MFNIRDLIDEAFEPSDWKTGYPRDWTKVESKKILNRWKELYKKEIENENPKALKEEKKRLKELTEEKKEQVIQQLRKFNNQSLDPWEYPETVTAELIKEMWEKLAPLLKENLTAQDRTDIRNLKKTHKVCEDYIEEGYGAFYSHQHNLIVFLTEKISIPTYVHEMQHFADGSRELSSFSTELKASLMGNYYRVTIENQTKITDRRLMDYCQSVRTATGEKKNMRQFLRGINYPMRDYTTVLEVIKECNFWIKNLEREIKREWDIPAAKKNCVGPIIIILGKITALKELMEKDRDKESNLKKAKEIEDQTRKEVKEIYLGSFGFDQVWGEITNLKNYRTEKEQIEEKPSKEDDSFFVREPYPYSKLGGVLFSMFYSDDENEVRGWMKVLTQMDDNDKLLEVIAGIKRTTQIRKGGNNIQILEDGVPQRLWENNLQEEKDRQPRKELIKDALKELL